MAEIADMLIVMTLISIFVISGNFILEVDTIGDVFINKMLNGYSTGKVNINADLDNRFDKTISQSESGSFVYYMGIIDGLKKVFSWIISIATLGFALFNLLFQTGAPLIICSVLGLPFAVAFYVGVISFIRGFTL